MHMTGRCIYRYLFSFDHYRNKSFFDSAYFRNDDIVENLSTCDVLFQNVKKLDSGEKWYSMCCYKTTNAPFAGTIPHGVVSMSGLGDGFYNFKYVTENEKVVALQLVFIDETADDDY